MLARYRPIRPWHTSQHVRRDDLIKQERAPEHAEDRYQKRQTNRSFQFHTGDKTGERTTSKPVLASASEEPVIGKKLSTRFLASPNA